MKIRCPHLRTKGSPYTDETYEECELGDRPSGRTKPCHLTSGSECDIFEEIKEEWANE